MFPERLPFDTFPPGSGVQPRRCADPGCYHESHQVTD